MLHETLNLAIPGKPCADGRYCCRVMFAVSVITIINLIIYMLYVLGCYLNSSRDPMLYLKNVIVAIVYTVCFTF